MRGCSMALYNPPHLFDGLLPQQHLSHPWLFDGLLVLRNKLNDAICHETMWKLKQRVDTDNIIYHDITGNSVGAPMCLRHVEGELFFSSLGYHYMRRCGKMVQMSELEFRYDLGYEITVMNNGWFPTLTSVLNTFTEYRNLSSEVLSATMVGLLWEYEENYDEYDRTVITSFADEIIDQLTILDASGQLQNIDVMC